MAKTSEKLELINSLQESLSEKEMQYKDVSDKLLQTELAVSILTFIVSACHSLMFSNNYLGSFFASAAGYHVQQMQQLRETVFGAEDRSQQSHTEAEHAQGEGVTLVGIPMLIFP